VRFTAEGPDIPDDLLVARDRGDVVFFCGAGVSRARADLPDFGGLLGQIVDDLGASKTSPARTLGVSIDRRFRLLEREFETSEVRAAVATRLRARDDVDLTPHRHILDLARTPSGLVRLVTTNFDTLFERADPALASSTPPRLPDPHDDQDFHGVIHIHGRLGDDGGPPPDLVLSSADFGRAYLADGWATRFIRRLLERYQVVFLGYSAEDPPVQYLLEALDLGAGTRKRLYAFESTNDQDAIGLWEHKGVSAIPYHGGYGSLWETLGHWAERARDPSAWLARVFAAGAGGPEGLPPYQRGQVAHIIGTAAGAQQLVVAADTLPASWLNAFDRTTRYATPERPYRAEGEAVADPFSLYALDTDVVPPPMDPTDYFKRREVPRDAWDGLSALRTDQSPGRPAMAGADAVRAAPLTDRQAQLGVWLQRVAHDPAALLWAGRHGGVHTDIRSQIEWSLRRDAARFSPIVAQGWRWLFLADPAKPQEADQGEYDLRDRVAVEGWSRPLVRTWSGLFRPRLTVDAAIPVGVAPIDPPESVRDLLRLDVAYPRPHETRPPSDEWVAYAVECFRNNLNLAVALESDVRGEPSLYLTPSRGNEGELVDPDAFGVTGLLAMFQALFTRLTTLDPPAARRQIASWPSDDEHLFARLRIWAAGLPGALSGDEAAEVFHALDDRIFWGSEHRRDLLFALRDRWPDLSDTQRARLERRLLTGTYPFESSPEFVAQFAANDQLNVIQWLSSAGITFDFDLEGEIRTRREIDLDWTPARAEAAAEGNAVKVYSITTDTDPAPLAGVALKDVFETAGPPGRRRLQDRVQRDPFSGLSESRPAHALAALSLADRSESGAPPWAWGDFLRSDARSRDGDRLLLTIIKRLLRLPVERMAAIAWPVSDWMRTHAPRLHAAPRLADDLWNAVTVSLAQHPPEERPVRPGEWADQALNSPVGRLFAFAMEDPRRLDARDGQGLHETWTGKLDELLALPGRQRGQAVVLAAHQVTWLFHNDPAWTTRTVLSFRTPGQPFAEAFWEGFLWAARSPSDALLALLRDHLLDLAARTDLTRRYNRIVGGILLDAWGRGLATGGAAPFISSVELRELLIQGDDELRRDILWSLSQWAATADSEWTARLIPFLQTVWPRQRAVRTPAMSSCLADLVLSVPERFAETVPLILPRLVPLRRHESQLDGLDEDDPGRLVESEPGLVLDLLWALLGEDAEGWPYGVEIVIERLARQTAVADDSRLAALRRRREPGAA